VAPQSSKQPLREKDHLERRVSQDGLLSTESISFLLLFRNRLHLGGAPEGVTHGADAFCFSLS